MKLILILITSLMLSSCNYEAFNLPVDVLGSDVGIINKIVGGFYGSDLCWWYWVKIPHEVAYGSAVAAVKNENGWAFALPNDVENHIVTDEPVFGIVGGDDNFIKSVSFVSIHVANLAAMAAIMDPYFLEFCTLCDDGR